MSNPRLRAAPPQWFWIASIWLFVAMFDAAQTVFAMRAEGMHHDWVKLFITLVMSWLPWAIATPFVLRRGRQFPWARKQLSLWVANLAVCASVGLIYAGWAALLEELLNPYAKLPAPGQFRSLWIDKFYGGLLSYVIVYGAIVLVSHILESRERLALHQTETAKLNEQLSKARLDALRRQIEPHFLFNTLNAITGLVREKRNDAAVNMIAGLSDFLRGVVEDSDRQQVPLEQELEFAQRYLDIQKVRFADRLQFSVDVPKELLPAQVPSLILQPMVENAVKHGIAKRVQGGAVRISASRANGTLTLSVYNDGPDLPVSWEKNQSGVGIANVRTRLQTLYGDEFKVNMVNQAPGGVAVSVSLPFISAACKE